MPRLLIVYGYVRPLGWGFLAWVNDANSREGERTPFMAASLTLVSLVLSGRSPLALVNVRQRALRAEYRDFNRLRRAGFRMDHFVDADDMVWGFLAGRESGDQLSHLAGGQLN